jgi:hypothetical protein
LANSVIAEDIVHFNRSLRLDKALPENIRVMNPFKNPEALRISEEFYRKYYSDKHPRHLIIAINPGRFGAGVTGIPFTDTARLKMVCGINPGIPPTHEPSSVFVYEIIDAYGGTELFYRNFYITSVCPLGFVKENEKGKEVNFNYYDSKELEKAVTPFIVESLQKQFRFNLDMTKCICWGRGKNFQFLSELNSKYHFFEEIIPLDHPRFIMQYRAKQKKKYIENYLKILHYVSESI